MLKNPTNIKEILRRQKLQGHFFAMFLLLRYEMTLLVEECQRTLMDESGTAGNHK
jgi:hypothetical protein